MKLTRESYQRGSLTTENRKSGPDVWIFRWRERSSTGFIKRKRIVGTIKQYPTRASAAKAVAALHLNVNAMESRVVTVAEAAAHYRSCELTPSCGKSRRTLEVYAANIDRIILPRWGNMKLRDVKPVALEQWLQDMPGALGTRAKVRCVFSVLFQHAMRHEWALSNPVRLARQPTGSSKEQIVLEPCEIQAILGELRDPFQTLVFAASVTGLRRGELFGLKWEDVNFGEGQIAIVRSLVDQVEGPPKTLASRRPIPMSPGLAGALLKWRGQTDFGQLGDWVFASPQSLGRKPYWPDAVLKRHILPAADRAGVTKRIGWHSFRRTLATLLLSSGASVKTTQELLRHASPQMTLGVYAKAVNADKRNAQASIAALFGQHCNGLGMPDEAVKITGPILAPDCA